MSDVRLTSAASIDDYVARPEGRFIGGKSWLHVCESESLYAFYLWGRPGSEQARQLIRALATEVRPGAHPHRTYVDFSALSGIDVSAFVLLRDFLEEVKAIQKVVTQQEALIRPQGLAGTVVAGFYLLYPPTYPARVFTEKTEAIEWLGLDAKTVRRWEKLARGDGAELEQLRAVLEANLSDADLPRIAKRLGLSSRTLQRRLKAQGTSFQRELDQVRLVLAETLVAGSDEKLTTVAQRVGFSSYQHFSEWFHRQCGVTADELRARGRDEGVP